MAQLEMFFIPQESTEEANVSITGDFIIHHHPAPWGAKNFGRLRELTLGAYKWQGDTYTSNYTLDTSFFKNQLQQLKS